MALIHVEKLAVAYGQQEKKFHGCVLVASPFFDQILKSNFLEKETGNIEMAIGTPATLEMAVMYLYGRRPMFTEDNIDHMMDLAEFLLIPNLKSACVRWITTRLNITEENCMNIIKLSSLYEFNIPECEKYIEGHMLETLQHNMSLNLTKDSILSLFLDPKLSYVPMDFKINFLVRWAKSNPEKRMNNILKELLEETIDLIDVSTSLLEALSEDKNLKDFIDFEEILGNPRNECTTHRVLIMKSNSNNEFWCLDLERGRWFIVASGAYEEDRFCRTNAILGSRGDLSEIYFKSLGTQWMVKILDLEVNTCKTFKFVTKDRWNDSVQLSMVENVCVVKVEDRKLESNPFSPDIDISSRLNHISRRRMMENGGSCEESSHIDMSSLYIGTIDNECIEMSRFLCFEGHEISQICVNKINTLTIVAILFKSFTHVSLFDIENHKVETIHTKTVYGDKLERCEDGFVIYNDTRCICLTKVELCTHLTKYEAKEIFFEKNNIITPSGRATFQKRAINRAKQPIPPIIPHTYKPTHTTKSQAENKDMNRNHKYFFLNNNWYHYYREIFQDSYQFESALHKDVISNLSFVNIPWNQLPPPPPRKISTQHIDNINERLFQIILPRSKLLCDIDCPHCKIIGRTTWSGESTWLSDTEDDSSDDAYYEDEFYNGLYGYSMYHDEFEDSY